MDGHERADVVEYREKGLLEESNSAPKRAKRKAMEGEMCLISE